MSDDAPLSWEQSRLFMRRPALDDLPEIRPLPDGYVLRLYQPADCTSLAALLSRAFEDTRDEEWVRSQLTEAPDVDTVYVVARGGEIVATASSRLMTEEYPGSGYLHWVGADPNQQGRGLGTAVSLAVLHHFRELGLCDAVLETQTHRLPAIRTYLRLGFVPEYRYGDPDEQRRWAAVLPKLIK